MKIHLIAIGGAVMHNLAIALHKEGHHVTGSDDEIRDPAKSRLDKYNLLPQKIGWQPEIIDADTNLIILGMHARNDNPELLKAAQLGIEVMSFPDYVYHRCQTKKRVVIAGSHGKTTITSMIMHVLQTLGHDFDYLVGSQIEGFETMVGFSQQSEILIAEGDEYLASPVDRRPKFLLYHADVVLISGIAWDHINVFPTFEIYKDQFKQLVNQMPAQAPLIFYEADDILSKMALSNTQGLTLLPYNEPNNTILNGKTTLHAAEGDFELSVFGAHNLANLNGARLVCNQLGIENIDFYTAIASFKGAARRLELMYSTDDFICYRDFAHAPSKLKATVNAVAQQFPEKKLIAIMELHSFSSLDKNFLQEYKHSMNQATEAYVFFNPGTIAHKGLQMLSEKEVFEAFDNPNLKVFSNQNDLLPLLKPQPQTVLLLMSSGNFNGININF